MIAVARFFDSTNPISESYSHHTEFAFGCCILREEKALEINVLHF